MYNSTHVSVLCVLDISYDPSVRNDSLIRHGLGTPEYGFKLGDRMVNS